MKKANNRAKLKSIKMLRDESPNPEIQFEWSLPEDMSNFGGTILAISYDGNMPEYMENGQYIIDSRKPSPDPTLLEYNGGPGNIDNTHFNLHVTTPGQYDAKVALFTLDKSGNVIGESSKCVVPRFYCITKS